MNWKCDSSFEIFVVCLRIGSDHEKPASLPQVSKAANLRTGNIYLYFPILRTGNALNVAHTEFTVNVCLSEASDKFLQPSAVCRQSHPSTRDFPVLSFLPVLQTSSCRTSFCPFQFQGYCPSSACRKVILVSTDPLIISLYWWKGESLSLCFVLLAV